MHFVGYLLAPGIELIAPAIAASIYLPLSALSTLGMPVFANSGWGSPSTLGWLLATLLWAGVWWAIACGAAALFRSKSSDNS